MSRLGNVHRTEPAVPERLGLCVEAACVMEVLAPKAGNVSPGQSWNFRDLGVADFLASARAIRGSFDRAGELPIGSLVLEAVRATRRVVSTNTNLGQILLLAPLAKAAAASGRIEPLEMARIVRNTTVEDAEAVYEAIALAVPGGMGKRGAQDLGSRPTCTLHEAMTLAAGYDDVAAQYSGEFTTVFAIARSIAIEIAVDGDWKAAIARVHLARLAEGDTLVRRKCGADVEAEMQSRARAVLAANSDPARYREAADAFDFWLRADGNRRNPGTTADLVTAGLFVGLFHQSIEIPAMLFEEAAAFVADQGRSAKSETGRNDA